MANAKEIQESNEQHQRYDEDHKCHVYDLFFEDETGQEKAGRYRTFFYATAGRDRQNFAACAGYAQHSLFQQEESIPAEEERLDIS